MPESQFDERLGVDEGESRGRDQQPRSPNLVAKAFGSQLYYGGQSPGASHPSHGIAARSQRDVTRLSLSPSVVRSGVSHVYGQHQSRLGWGGPPSGRMNAEMQQKRSGGIARGPPVLDRKGGGPPSSSLVGPSSSSGRGVIPTNPTARMPSGTPFPNFRATTPPVQIARCGAWNRIAKYMSTSL